ncbi:SRPBCC family protein [Candidatus Neomarinimicrobiota bacterium]
MFKLEHHIKIQEHPKVVWAFLANLPMSQGCRRWRRSFRWLGDLTPAVGSRYITEILFSGMSFRQEGKITRWEPPETMTLTQWNDKYPRMGLTHQLGYSIESVEGQPQATTLHSTVIGNFVPRSMELVFKEMIRRSMIDHLVLLKRAIESTDKGDRLARQPAHPIAEAPAVGG